MPDQPSKPFLTPRVLTVLTAMTALMTFASGMAYREGDTGLAVFYSAFAVFFAIAVWVGFVERKWYRTGHPAWAQHLNDHDYK